MPQARYVPVHEARGTAHVIVDSLPVAGTVLTLSHWPGAINPIKIESDTSTGIVLDFLSQGGRPSDVGPCTAVHFDIDGLLALHLAIRGCADLDVPFVRDLARAGDFRIAATPRSRRGAFALDSATVAISRSNTLPEGPVGTATVYRQLLTWLDEHMEELQAGTLAAHHWAVREGHYERSAALLESNCVSWHRLAGATVQAIEVHADDESSPVLDSHVGPYLGLDEYALHERCRSLAVLVSRKGRHRLAQRYESWVQGSDPSWACRRDLAPLCTYLRARDPAGDWRYGGVYHPFAQLETGPQGISSISTKRLHALIEHFHETSAPAWHPHLTD